MANKISTEVLIMILNNVQSTQDLYSSLLVNRIWCKVTVPILWKLPFEYYCPDILPFGQEYYRTDDENWKKKALCIRTYISCMDTQARTLLTQNGFDLSSSPPQATFDYPSFNHKFIINNLIFFISIYLPQIISPYQDNNENESRLLFREMCKLIINRCTFLDSFSMAIIKGFSNFDDLTGSILKLPGAPKVFKKLESFTSTIGNYEQLHPLYESLALICDNILNMNFYFFSDSQTQLSAKLISAQKRLENLSISFHGVLDYNSIFGAITSQKETLKSLHLKFLNFFQDKDKSSPIGQFISLQELHMEYCGFGKSDNLFFASSFPQLSSFYFRYGFNKYSQEFTKKILETANINLKNICLYFDPAFTSDIFSTIVNYCTKITKLALGVLNFEQVIAIFNNNFNGLSELRRFSFTYLENADELLWKIAKNVPESLETIEIRMGIFRADSLRKFFEGWCCKGRGENKKIIVKRIEKARLFILSDEHFKVCEEYGVRFEMEEIDK